MVAIKTPFFIILSALLATVVDAAPRPVYSRHATHHVRTIGKRGDQIVSYHPPSTFIVSKNGDPLTEKLFGNNRGVSFSRFEDSKKRIYEYFKQFHSGLPIVNAVSNIVRNNRSSIISYGISFVNVSSAAPSVPTVNLTNVINDVREQMNADPIGSPTLEYLLVADGTLALTHVVQMKNAKEGTWYETYVDAHSGKILSVTDFVADASYIAVPATKQSFKDGVVDIDNPADIVASPFGWHDIGLGNSNSTQGNNVIAVQNIDFRVVDGLPGNQTSPGLIFGNVYDATADPTVGTNPNAAQVNAFYVLNVMHDFTYRYGFTEERGNFQFNNTNKGPLGNDRVFVSVQDESGTNTAQFATPPDGQSPECRMFIFDTTEPRRDSAMDNDILIHEMTHGITNRLTGGGTARCLQTLEAGGLGEGWADAMASWMNQNSSKTRDYVLGTYASNNEAGLRKFPYSTSKTVNPLTYADVRKAEEVHAIGEVWATMLHEVYAALVDKHGFSSEKLTNPEGTEGNIVFMNLFLDSLMIQPCNPTFVQTRDAWYAADAVRYNGDNKCLLQQAFARRGLGLGAADFVDDATVDTDCTA